VKANLMVPRAAPSVAFFKGLILIASCALSEYGNAQTARSADLNAAGAPAFHLNVSVDEVALLFHASGVNGLPVNDLKLDELRLLDNGRAPRRIVQFQALENMPIRAGILIDTSESMTRHLAGDRKIAAEYTQRFMRTQTDQSFVMDFGYSSQTQQAWTSQPTVLANVIRSVAAGRQNPLGGTALFDTIYKACLYEFGRIDHAASGNFILLFTDGEDNVSHTSAEEVIDACQHSNTAIYAFRAEPKQSASSGPRTLAQLASGTGGRIFFDDDTEGVIDKNLAIIEADLRNQYRLVFSPAELKHDGSFHPLELHTPDRVQAVNIRTGYYDRDR
jgi:Ca-activated chloride channel family protein